MRRDPDSIREWQQRSAETAARRAAERARRAAESGVVSTLAPVSRRRRDRDEAEGRAPRRETLRRSTAGLTASPAQRAKVAGLGSIISGRHGCDPAHLWPQGRGGCRDPLCVVPLTRDEHLAFDAGELDILPALIDHGCWPELAHAIEVHHADPLSLLHRLTGERHEPESALMRRAEVLARKLIREGLVA